MQTNFTNWQDCAMFVQDLVSPGLNVTAEISKEETYNFQGMCQMFSNSQRHSPTKVPNTIAPVRRTASLSSLPSSKPCVSHTKVMKEEKTKQTVNLTKKVPTKKGAVKNPTITLDDAIRDGKIYELITEEMSKILSRSDERVRHEARILGMLKHQFKIFDRTLELIPFGSTTFGLGNSTSNYNILVDTRKFKFYINFSEIWHGSYDCPYFSTGKSQQVQTLVLESFEKYLAKTDIQLHFKEIAEIPASRTMKQQLRMIHIESGIHVILLADDIAIADTPKIIRDFIAIKPICKILSFLSD